MGVVDFTHAASELEIEDIRRLFSEYGRSLNFNLCFQSFEEELRDLPGAYAAPRGRLILALVDGSAAGCVALKPLDGHVCEMKRLYVRPEARGSGLGRLLVAALLREARSRGYRAMRLDTVPGMDAAIALYRACGFEEIAPYRPNPIVGALYLEKDLEREP